MPPLPHLSRRDLLRVSLTASGALLIGCAADPPAPTPAPAAPTAPATSAPALTAIVTPPGQVSDPPPPTATTATATIPEQPFTPSLFVRIDPDGQITLTVHRSEMGQGARTALAMILADELEADWASVRVEQSPADSQIGNQITSGSGTIAGSYSVLRAAGAAARQILTAAAAQIWGVPAMECRAEQGAILHDTSGRRLGYGELASLAATLAFEGDAPMLKNPADFRLIGTSVPRVDGPAIVRGEARYGIDVRLPGMQFATVARCPVPGGKLASYDAAKAMAIPGVRAVVEVPSGVAVVAEHTWAAIQGRAALTITWDEGEHAALSTKDIRGRLAELIEKATADEGASSATTIEAVYETPYVAHATMEPICCVADARADVCEIWASTQNPQGVREYVQRSVGLPTVVHVTLLGGGFGRRLEVDFAIEAAQVSKAAGAPAQVVWTRDDDLQHDFYRQPTRHWMRAGWDAAGKVDLWRHYVAGQGINGIAYQAGNEVLEADLEVSYAVSGQRTDTLLAKFPIPTGPWRAVVAGPNAFANECFLDEVAAARGEDPYALRMRLLREHDLLRPVVELAAERAGWGGAPPEGRARGIACHNTSGQTAVAMVAEISVAGGALRVHRVVCAIDCGVVINPDMVAQQLEGAVADGLTTLLKGEITISQGRVEQSNFDDYPLLTIGEMPEVSVHILPSTRAPRGVGEMGVPPIVPAVLNAVYAATGVRIRRIPIRGGDLPTG